MPWTDTGFPFSGATPEAEGTSRASAADVEAFCESQMVRLITWLQSREDGDDWLARRELRMLPQTLCGRRGQLRAAGVLHAVTGMAGVRRHQDGPGRPTRRYHAYRVDRLPVAEILRLVAINDALAASRATRRGARGWAV